MARGDKGKGAVLRRGKTSQQQSPQGLSNASPDTVSCLSLGVGFIGPGFLPV